MARGMISLSLIAVKDMLRLPKEYEFLEAAYNSQTGTLEILVEHPDIPQAVADTRHIEVRSIYQTEHTRIVRLTEVKMIEHKETTEPREQTMKRLGRRRHGHGNDRL